MTRLKAYLLLFTALVLLVSCKEEDITDKTTDKNVLPCFITADMVLTNHNPDGVDYYVNCIAEVSAGTLTILPGVEIVFRPGSGLRITNAATIKAIGLDTLPIKFNGTTTTPSWLGISIESSQAGNELAWSQITNAGQGEQFNTQVAGFLYDAASAVSVYGKLKMHHCTITHSGGNGVSFTSEATTARFSHNNFINNGGYPVLTYGGALPNMMLDSCTYTGNKNQYIALFSKTSNAVVEESITIPATTIPYLAISDMFFAGNATINAGATIIMDKELGMGVIDNGKMLINGTVANHVTIKGAAATSGYWKGILINSQTDNEFNYLDISDGGHTAYYVAEKTNIAVGSAAPAKLTLNNCTSERYPGTCAVAYSDTDGTFTNNSPLITNVCKY